MNAKRGQIGSSFSQYLEEEGLLEETTAVALKRVLAWQFRQAMENKQITKNAMAKAMNTSRSQLDRILDPDNGRIQLDTLVSAARVLGRELQIKLV